jgi:hypothetical protein
LLILVGPLLRLVRPLRILTPALLGLMAPKILLSILPRLHLRKAERPHRAAPFNALAGRRHDRQTKEQDRRGHRRRTHSFRVGCPVHESFSEPAPSGAWLPARPK